MLEDLSETDSGISNLATRFISCCDLYFVVWKDDLTFRDSQLSAATCVCHIEFYLTHVQVKG